MARKPLIINVVQIETTEVGFDLKSPMPTSDLKSPIPVDVKEIGPR
jgi:hypothetical protein